MSYDIIPVLFIILGMGGILLIVGLKIPILLQQSPAILADGQIGENGNSREKILNWLSGKKVLLAGLVEKILRKIRIFSMKADNLCSHWLMKMKNKALLPEKKAEDVQTTKGQGMNDIIIQTVKREEIDNALREQELIKMITLNPKDINAYKKLADLYLAQHNLKDAEACLKQVLKLEPDNKEIKKKLEKING